MTDPVTLTVLGGIAATEGIKFLYGQAADLLKAWRERRAKNDSGEVAPPKLAVPIRESEVLDGIPAQEEADPAVLDREADALVKLIGAVSPYAQGLADVDPNDKQLAEQAGKLRALLEAAYGQRFTFRGEQREPTGTRVTVTQVLGEVQGSVLGAEADVAAGSQLDVEQGVTAVTETGQVTGFKGNIGT